MGSRSDSNLLTLIGAASVGAALMYFLDPQRGNRRRHLLADKAIRAKHDAADTAGKTRRDLANRAHGIAATVRARFDEDIADDRVIEERVRANVGRATSHAGAIDTIVSDGLVTVSGHVLADEAELVLDTVRTVRGVDGVEDQLQRFTNADGVSDLQDGAPAV